MQSGLGEERLVEGRRDRTQESCPPLLWEGDSSTPGLNLWLCYFGERCSVKELLPLLAGREHVCKAVGDASSGAAWSAHTLKGCVPGFPSQCAFCWGVSPQLSQAGAAPLSFPFLPLC